MISCKAALLNRKIVVAAYVWAIQLQQLFEIQITKSATDAQSRTVLVILHVVGFTNTERTTCNESL